MEWEHVKSIVLRASYDSSIDLAVGGEVGVNFGFYL